MTNIPRIEGVSTPNSWYMSQIQLEITHQIVTLAQDTILSHDSSIVAGLHNHNIMMQAYYDHQNEQLQNLWQHANMGEVFNFQF